MRVCVLRVFTVSHDGDVGGQVCDRDHVKEEVGELVPGAEVLINEATERAAGHWPFPSFRPPELRVEPPTRRKARAQAKAKTNLRKMKVLGQMAGQVNMHLDVEKRQHEARVAAKRKVVFDRQEKARLAAEAAEKARLAALGNL